MDDPAKPICDAIERRRLKIENLQARQKRDAQRLLNIRMTQIALRLGPADPREEEADAAMECLRDRLEAILHNDPVPDDGGLDADMVGAWARLSWPVGDDADGDASTAASLFQGMIASAPTGLRIALLRALLGCQYPE